MKWRDLGLTLGLLLILAPFLHAQTLPGGGMGSLSGGVGKFADGACGTTPSITFAADPDTGFYRPASGAVELCSNGARGPQFSGGTFGTTGGGSLTTIILGAGGGATQLTTGGTVIASAVLINGNDGVSPTSLSTAGTRGLALPAGSIGIATSATTTVGNVGQGARFVVVCGPTAGTASLLFYAGTTNTPVVLANAVGGGLIGC